MRVITHAPGPEDTALAGLVMLASHSVHQDHKLIKGRNLSNIPSEFVVEPRSTTERAL